MSLADQIAKETVQNIINYLKNNQNTNSVQIIKEIETIIVSALNQLQGDEKKQFYKRLSISLHPDKIETNEKELYSLLNAKKIVDEPFKILNTHYNKKNIVNEIADDPVDNTLNLIVKLLDQASYHLKLYRRYYQPIKALVFIASWLINITLAVAVIGLLAMAVIVANAISTLDKIQEVLRDIVLGGDLKNLTAHLVREPIRFKIAEENYYTKLKDEFIKNLEKSINHAKEPAQAEVYKKQLQEIKQMSVEDYKRYYINELAKKLGKSPKAIEEEQRINIEKASYKQHLTGFNKLTTIATVFKNKVFGPLPAGVINKLFSIFIARPIVALLAPIVLAATAAIEVAKNLNAIFVLGGIVALAGLKVATLIILNAPLYLLDTARIIGNKFSKETNKPTHNNKPSAANDENLNSYSTMFGSRSSAQPKTQAQDKDLSNYSKGTRFFIEGPKNEAKSLAPALSPSAMGPN
ncbi:hypothetical protein ACNVED_11820 [Legionella sp. D16C41]|uniref:hypothetical protein n=1 Tax=Legionella sp. D16C41 TaxID=3402688 RepID=UPI003AF9B734